MDYNNTAILAKDQEQSKKIIEFYRSKGYDTKGFIGNSTELPKYYGVEDNNFKFFAYNNPKPTTKIIELPSYPRVMLVSKDVNTVWSKRVVFMEKNNKYIAWADAETLEEAEKALDTYTWSYAKEVEEEQATEITIEEIAKLLNKPKHLIKIVDNVKQTRYRIINYS